MVNTPRGNPFSNVGADYAHHRPTWPDGVALTLAGLCPRTDHALDVGCGSGQLSAVLADHFTQVTATDPSADQIAHAVKRPDIDYRCEPAETMSLADRSVDAVTAAQAAHWFDLDAFYSEVHRVCRPGGIVALLTYGVPEMAGAVGERYSHFYWREIFSFWPEERRHVETGYAGLRFPFREIPLPEMNVERDWTLADFLGYMRTWSALREAEKAGKTRVFADFEVDLRALWGDPKAAKRIAWPIRGRVGRLPRHRPSV
ncbi:MAG: methyltransferase domain-containing protein [Flavobacteriaceae bacterium]